MHGARLPMNDTYTDRFRTNILNKLRKNGVNVILEDKLEDFTPSPDGTITTEKGKVLNADLVVCGFSSHPDLQLTVLCRSQPSVALPTPSSSKSR